MNLFRSETMQYFKIVLPKNNAVTILSAMETIGHIHFVDRAHHPGIFKNAYTDTVKKCSEMLSKIDEIEKKMVSEHVEIVQPTDVEYLYSKLQELSKNRKATDEKVFADLEQEMEEVFKRVQDSTNTEKEMLTGVYLLKKKLCFYQLVRQMLPEESFTKMAPIVTTDDGEYMQQERKILRQLDTQEKKAGSQASNASGNLEKRSLASGNLEKRSLQTSKARIQELSNSSSANLRYLAAGQFKLGYLAGVIKTADIDIFTRSIYRMARGKVIINQLSFTEEMMVSVKDPDDAESKANLSAFVILLPYNDSDAGIARRMQSIVNSYHARLFAVPNSLNSMNRMIEDLDHEYHEMSDFRKRVIENVHDKLSMLAEVNKELGCSKLEEYKAIIKKYKLVYSTLCLFTESSSLLIGSFWTSKNDRDKIAQAVDELKKDDPSFISANIYPVTHDKTPPTLFRTNDFTQPFQTIVETYAIPKYKEINPALVSTVTFPFLFGLMFGDVAHGLCLFVMGCYTASSSLAKSPKTRAIYKLRYLLMFMGFFSTYAGFIYNDFMGIKMVNFRSCYYEETINQVDPAANTTTTIIMTKKPDCVYPVGFDHVWGFARNEITFENSFKMKFSIIVGFLQMCLGIIFRGWNALYFKNYIDFIFEFIPQLAFMTCIFGYMCLCIIIKWLTDWSVRKPPSIINIFTSLTSVVTSPLLSARRPSVQ